MRGRFETDFSAACVDCGSWDCEGWDAGLLYGLTIVGETGEAPVRVGREKVDSRCNDCGLRWVA